MTPDVAVSPCEEDRGWQQGRSCGCPGGTPAERGGWDMCPLSQGRDTWLLFSYGGTKTQLGPPS